MIKPTVRPYERFISLLFWRQERSHSFQYIIELISQIQLIAIIGSMLFYIQEPSKEDQISAFILNIFETISVFNLSAKSSQTAFRKVILYSTWGYLIFVIIFGISTYWQCFKNNEIQAAYRQFMSYWAQTHHTTVFWIIHAFLLSRFSQIFFNNTFGSQTQYIELTFDLLFFVVNLLFSLLAASYCYDPFMSTNPFSVRNTTFQIATVFFKMLIGLLLTFNWNKETLRWTFLGLSTILTGLRHEFLLKAVPYHRYSALVLTSCLSGCAFFMSLTGLGLAILVEFELVDWSNLYCVQTPLIILGLKITYSRIQSLIKTYSSLSHNDLKNSSDVFKKLFVLGHNIDKSLVTFHLGSVLSCSLSYIYLHADTAIHHLDCRDEYCSCHLFTQNNSSDKNPEKIEMSDSEKESDQFRVDIQSHLLSFSVRKFSKNNDLRIHYVYNVLQNEKKLPKAVFAIFDPDKLKMTFRQKLLLFLVSKYIEQKSVKFKNHLDKGESQSIDIKALLQSQETSNELINLTKKYTSSYLQLWNYYLRPNMLLIQFFRKTIMLEIEAQKIEKLWKSLSNLNHSIPIDILSLYQSYMMLLRNAPFTASKFSKRANNQLSKYSDVSLGKTESNVVVYVSMSRDKLGKIIQTSHSMQKEFGWSQDEIIEQSIQNLLPPYLRVRHAQLLENYVLGDNKRPAIHYESFIQTREGYIVPVNVFVTVFPYILNEPIYVAIINKRSISREVLVIGPDGYVNCFSKDFGFNLGLNIQNKIHINQICRNPEKIGLDFSHRKKSFIDSSNERFSRISIADHIGPPKSTEKEIISLEQKFKEVTLKFHSLSFLNELSYAAQVQKLYSKDDTNYYLLCLNYHHKDSDRVTLIEEAHPSPYLISKRQNRASLTKYLEPPSSARNDDHLLKSERLTGSRSLRKINHDLSETSYRSNDNLGANIESNRAKNHTQVLSYVLSPANLENTKNRIKLSEILKNISCSTSSDSKQDTRLKRLEEAVYAIPRDYHAKTLNWLIILFGLLCLSLMILHLINGNIRLDKTLNNVDTIAAIQTRSIQLIDLYRNVQYITLVNRGLMKDTRHLALGVPSFRLMRRQAIKDNRQLLNSLNNMIRNNIIEAWSFGAFSKLIDVNDGKSTLKKRKVDSFELFTEISNAASILSRTEIPLIILSNSNVQFILQNSLNDLYLFSGDMIININENSIYQLDLTGRDVWIFMFVSLAAGAFLLITLSLYILDFVKKRNKIISFLTRIKDKQLSDHLETVSRFYQLFWENKTIISKNSKLEKAKNPETYAKQLNRNVRRTQSKLANHQGLNTKIKIGVMSLVISVIIFSSVFFVLKVDYTLNQNSFLLQFEHMVKVNQLLITLSVGIASILSFVSGDNTTLVLNKPIEQTIRYILEESRNIPDFLSSLTSNRISDSHVSLLRNLMMGDLCQLIQVPNMPTAVCQKLGAGVISGGIIRLVSFLARGNEEAFYAYIFSNRTLEASRQALNLESLIATEQVGSYSLKASEMARSILKEDLKESITTYKKQTIWIIIGYFIVYLILGSILSTKTWRKIKEEKNSWTKLIRHVPFSIILENKEFETFIMKNYHNFLNSLQKTT